MAENPVKIEIVEAPFDITLQDPSGRTFAGEQDMTLLDRVSGAPFFPEPVGVRIRGGLGDWIEAQTMSRLACSIGHHGNT